MSYWEGDEEEYEVGIAEDEPGAALRWLACWDSMWHAMMMMMMMMMYVCDKVR